MFNSYSKKVNLFYVCVIISLFLCALYAPIQAKQQDSQNMPSLFKKNAKAVKQVENGKRYLASAAWWGFDSKDSTKALQNAINSKATRIIVPNMGKPWIVKPIKLRSNKQIILKEGVEIVAKRGEFKGKNDSLINAKNIKNISIIGQGSGATLRMHKNEYKSKPYKSSPYRMGFYIRSCANVTLENLTISSTGGDGIYLGVANKKSQQYNKNVIIRNIVCDNNYRQGISVISAQNLLIEDSVFKNTDGSSPKAGIDLEPNNNKQRLSNVIIRRCVSANNAGPGMYAYLSNLDDPEGEPISIRFEKCKIIGVGRFGLGVGRSRKSSPKGKIFFIDCKVIDTDHAGAYIYSKSKDGIPVRFVRCTFINTAKKSRSIGTGIPERWAPIVLALRRPSIAKKQGGVTFEDCSVEDNKDRPVIVARSKADGPTIYDLSGDIFTKNTKDTYVDFGKKAYNNSLSVTTSHP